MPAPKVDDEAVYEEKRPSPTTGNSSDDGTHNEHPAQRQSSVVAAKLRNPLGGMTEDEVIKDVDAFIEARGLADKRETFHKGALMARVQNRPNGYEHISMLSEEEKGWLRHEDNHRWSQPFMLYFLVVLCAGSAIVQGMDQTAVNGAQGFYFVEFGIEGTENDLLHGLINGAPYLCSALIGCWSNAPLNKYFGRRGTIFISCAISAITGIWMAAANNWPNLLVARFALGFAVGAKSSTTPVYAAESAPKNIRGALTMMWQMWTAFGIMLGFVASVAFQGTDFLGPNTQWRWMLGSTSIPPFIVMCQVYLCPESPRWYMEKGRWAEAFKASSRLRSHEIQASRDMYYAAKLLEVEAAERQGKSLWKEFFGVRRNRRAAQSAFFVMFMQQFCGVNVIAYYSTDIFMSGGFSQSNALLVSLGTGIVNWLFAIPAIYTIDTFGRRNLLLCGFPLMAICLFWGGFSFLIGGGPPSEGDPPNPAQLGSIAAAIFCFMAIYSPSEGPVPFTYSAEAFPLYIRDIGMSFATATCWGFNFIIAFSWPALRTAFTPTGAFCWYAAWNLFGTVYCYFLLPETKALTLEELDTVFNVGNREHAKYYTEKLPWYVGKYIMRRDMMPMAPMYEFTEETETRHNSVVDPKAETRTADI